MEETGQAEVLQETTNAPIENQTYIESDGTLKDGWVNLLDEDIRNEKSLATHRNIKTLAKTFVNAQRMVGKDKVAIPNENSSEGDWEAFYTAAGRPDSQDGYQMKRPDNLPEEYWNENFAKEAAGLFHKIGLNNKQAEALLKFNTENTLKVVNDGKIAKEQNLAELNTKLYEKWGNAYDQKIHLGNAAIEEGVDGDEEFKQRLLEKVNSDPDLIMFASNLGGKFAEHKGPNFGAIPTPADVQEQITTLEHNPLYLHGTKPERMAIADKLMKLREVLSKQKKG